MSLTLGKGLVGRLLAAAVPPVIVSLGKTLGDTGGGQSVPILGVAFTGATAVFFGAAAATSFIVNNDGLVTAVAPAHAAGSGAVSVVTPAGTSNAVAYEFWDPTVPGSCTNYAKKPNYARVAGVGTWTASAGANIVENGVGVTPAALAGAPNIVSPERLQMPATAAALFGSVAAVGGTAAVVIDLTAYVAGVANCVWGNSANSIAVLLEPGLVANFYYTDGTYKIAGPLAVPNTGRIAMVARRNITTVPGTPYIDFTIDGVTYAGSAATAVGNLINSGAGMFLGNNGIYPLSALYLAEAWATDDWSNADVTKFFLWQAATFP